MHERERIIMEERFRRLQKMAPEQKETLRRRLEMWQRIPPEKREKVRRILRILKGLPPEKLEELRRLPLPEKRRMIEDLLIRTGKMKLPPMHDVPAPPNPDRMNEPPLE